MLFIVQLNQIKIYFTVQKELGDYTLEHYINKKVLVEENKTMEDAITDKSIIPSLEKYNESIYLPYPKRILDAEKMD